MRILNYFRMKIADSSDKPYLIPAGFPIAWDIGAPSPFLLCSDYRTFLTFYVNEPDPNWDGTYVKVVNPASPEPAKLCLVTFKQCASAKLGHPNEDVQPAHPLASRGFQPYTAQIVKNSPWLKEIAKTNSVHPQDDPTSWKALNHYVFWFHDSTFECLAESYEVEVTSEPMSELLSRVHRMILS